MSKKSKKVTTQAPDPSLPVVNTGNAWLPVAPAGGVSTIAPNVQPPNPVPAAAPDPTAPLTVTTDMFVDGISETAPDGTVQSVPTNLCATYAAADQLRQWLEANGVATSIVYGAPTVADLQTDAYKFSALVPWLEDGKGARENAGTLLSEMQFWGQISRPVMLSQTVGAFALDDSLAKTDPTNQGLAGNVPNEDAPTSVPPSTEASK